jgi:hypothetical protein
MLGMKSRCLAHGFVEQHGDDSAMKKARPALIFLAEAKAADDALPHVVLLKRELHPARVRTATAEAGILGFRIESHESLSTIKPIRLSSP